MTGVLQVAFSSDGNKLFFESSDSSLVTGGIHGLGQIFEKDLTSGVVQCVSTNAAGVMGDNSCGNVSVSNDGRYLSFYSLATNLLDVAYSWTYGANFVKDLQTGAVAITSLNANGEQFTYGGGASSISGDGHYITIYTQSPNAWPGAKNYSGNGYRVDNPLSPSSTTVSTEWLSNTYVNDAVKVYLAYFGRPADLVGIKTTEDQIKAAGGDKAAITSMFANSPESQAFFAGKTVEQKVDTVYQQLCNRAAETAGKDYWVHQLDLGLMDQVTMCIRILDGAQGSDLTTINNKGTAAKDFTMHVSSTAYSGNTAAANGRKYISSISTDSGDLTKTHAALTSDFANHLGSDVAADLQLVGLHVGQYYAA